MDKEVTSLPGKNGDILLTRRHFLYGAVGVGALALASTSITGAVKEMQNAAKHPFTELEVAEGAVTSSDTLQEIEWEACVGLTGDFELPYGSLVWHNDPSVAACLIPTEAANPLTTVSLLYLGSGNMAEVLSKAEGAAEGFEIYDVRATSYGLVWTEADILEGTWRVYVASHAQGVKGKSVMVDEGDSAWETPTIAMVEDRAYWQVCPKKDGVAAKSNSALKSVRMGATEPEIACESTGRFACAPYSAGKFLIAAPRAATETTQYQLARFENENLDPVESLVLPSSMKPAEVAWGTNGFAFCFDAIYNYGGGIANLGTYTPMEPVSTVKGVQTNLNEGKTDSDQLKKGKPSLMSVDAGAAYNAVPWFRFGRAPSAPPAWCGDYFVVKSTRACCGVNLKKQQYFALDVHNGAADYGDFLATTGPMESFVTFANVHDKPIEEAEKKFTQVRVWTPLKPEPVTSDSANASADDAAKPSSEATA